MEMEDVDEGLRKLARGNLDQAPARRKVREAFKEIQRGLDHCLFKAYCPGLREEESYVVNSRGVEIFTKSWIPETPLKAIVCMCHGYGDTCTFFFEGIATKLASAGFGVFAMDYPGFGLSEGLHCYIPSFDVLVDDVVEQYSNVKENPDYKDLPRFLFGESMGGAVAVKIHLKQPHEWDGAILVAPMCKIADDVIPPWLVTQILIGLARLLPRNKLVPQKDLAELAFKDEQKRKLGKPRLKTALELLHATEEIGNKLENVSLPLLILHGEADIVTDPSVSKALYEKASSSDKTLRLYEDGCHALLEGESDEKIFQVLDEIITWLHSHSARNNSAS